MALTFAAAVVSLDGFVADLHDMPGPLFDWYVNGDVATTLGDPDRVFHVSSASADYLARLTAMTTVAVIGRRLFDITNGWEGVPAAGRHVVVVTHEPPLDWPFPDAPYSFVDGVREAVDLAQQLAGDGDVSVTGGQIAGQALALGLLDEVHLSVAPVVMGSGRPFFAGYDGPALALGEPEVIVGDRVRHQVYRVPRPGPQTAT